MGLKKNFIYNSILFLSQYVFPLITFPYISRVFGVEKVGLVNFTDSVVEYFVLLSLMGIGLVGLRECAKYKKDKDGLNKAFSGLLITHFLNTLIFLVVYLLLISFLDRFQENRTLFYIGASKILFCVFNVEWFYKGIENFRFITLRFLAVKILYVAAVFIWVKTPDDYIIYYALICGMTILNAFISIFCLKGRVSFVMKNIKFRQYLTPFYTIGFYAILTTLYTTLNIVFLGMYASDASVGNYSAALKLYMIIVGVFSALNIVLMPRLSFLHKDNQPKFFDDLINKSMTFVITLSFPLIFLCGSLASEFITVLAGREFSGAIACFQIIIPLVFIIGMSQIFANQILMSIKKDKELIIASTIGGIISIILSIFFVPIYKESATSYILLFSESIVMILLFCYSRKFYNIQIPLRFIGKNLICSFPYLLLGYGCNLLISNNIIALFVAGIIACLYFFISQYYFIKNEIVNQQMIFLVKRIWNKTHRNY